MEQFANNAQTTLAGSGPLSPGATSLTVTSASGFPASGTFRILVDSELLTVSSISGGTTFHLASATTLQHNVGAPITAVLTAEALAGLKSDVLASAGTVTSVGLSMPGEFSVSGTPVTSSGTLAVSKANQSANQVYAGPSSGSAAAPGFRAIVGADLPVFGASGSGHAVGAVPDPGSTAGTNRFLREDATWTAVAGAANYSINGGFRFAQRQAPGTYTTPTQTNGNAATTSLDGYTADRWKASFQTATLKYKRTDTAGSLETGITARYYGNYQQQTSAGKFCFYQIIEGVNTLPLASQSLTFQLKLKASASKTIRIAVLQNNSSATIDQTTNPIVSTWNSNSTDPTWGTNVAVVGSAVSCSVTTTWTNFSVSVTAPSNAQNLILAVWTDSQFSAGDTLSVTEAGLYVSGSTVSTWQPRPVQQELALCQRYYEKSYDSDTAPATTTDNGRRQLVCTADGTNYLEDTVEFKCNKRTAPTVMLYDRLGHGPGVITLVITGGTAVSDNWTPSTGAARVGESSFAMQTNNNGGNFSGVAYHFAADAEL